MKEHEALVSLRNLNLEEHPPAAETGWSPPPPPPHLTEVEQIIKYDFKNKELLNEAFTHASYKTDDCLSYERLEYLGDSVLNHLVAKLHFNLYKDMAPGELTRLRAANVDTEALARAALRHGLYKFLRHRKPLLDRQIQEFMEGIIEYPSHSYGMIDPPKVLADILESLIGAVFVDTDESMDDTWEVIRRLLQPLITPENLTQNRVSKLHEACQKIGLKPYVKDLWEKTGQIEFYINNELIGRGEYKLKRIIAVNRAADDAYNNLFGGKLGNKHGGIGA
ncbi:hypothetical protein SSX86_021126 [Deinandra increscens subsp. villosa]|uniref:RNase III domain-containing protein n=1 Tax=Deinandra increscens subsp. villosa TaxID=3103831 RepID=A0AAP0CUC1_9ASTR